MSLDPAWPSVGPGHNNPPPEKPVLPETQSLACPRVPVMDVISLLPAKFITSLEQNEKIAPCCRKAMRHDIAAFYSDHPARDSKTPDTYILYCTAVHPPDIRADGFDQSRPNNERWHIRFCVGGSAGSGPGTPVEHRPFWEVR